MDYDALEVELTGVLNSYFGANLLSSDPDVLLNTVFNARQMPEDQTELLQDYEQYPGGLVNVQYSDSSYGEPVSISYIYQEETIRVVCYVQCDKMKGASGGNKLLDCIKKALTGYKPDSARTRMWISGYGDWRIEDGEMKPYLEFSFRTVVQQVLSNDEDDTIDSESTLTVSGAFAEIDQDLYVLPDTEDVVKRDEDVF